MESPSVYTPTDRQLVGILLRKVVLRLAWYGVWVAALGWGLHRIGGWEAAWRVAERWLRVLAGVL